MDTHTSSECGTPEDLTPQFLSSRITAIDTIPKKIDESKNLTIPIPQIKIKVTESKEFKTKSDLNVIKQKDEENDNSIETQEPNMMSPDNK